MDPIVILVIGLCAGMVIGWVITWLVGRPIREAMRAADGYGFKRGVRAGREDERKCWEGEHA